MRHIHSAVVLDHPICLMHPVSQGNLLRGGVGVPNDGANLICPKMCIRDRKQVLGEYGIEVVEIPRRQLDGVEISASRVRERMKAGDYDAIRRMVPQTTMDFLLSEQGREIAERLRQGR